MSKYKGKVYKDRYPKNFCGIGMIQFKCQLKDGDYCIFAPNPVMDCPYRRAYSDVRPEDAAEGVQLFFCINPEAQRASLLAFLHSGKPMTKISEV